MENMAQFEISRRLELIRKCLNQGTKLIGTVHCQPSTTYYAIADTDAMLLLVSGQMTHHFNGILLTDTLNIPYFANCFIFISDNILPARSLLTAYPARNISYFCLWPNYKPAMLANKRVTHVYSRRRVKDHGKMMKLWSSSKRLSEVTHSVPFLKMPLSSKSA